jgi:hypothetical protein
MDTPLKIGFDEYNGIDDSHVFFSKNLIMAYINFKDKMDAVSVDMCHLTEAELIHSKTVFDNDFQVMTFYKEHMNQYVPTYENNGYVLVIR